MAELEARYTTLAHAGLAPQGREAWVAQQLAVLMTSVPRPEAIAALRAGITQLNQRLATEALREYQASVEQRLEIDRLEMARRVAEAETSEELARLERERALRRELEQEMRASAEAELRDIIEPLKDARAQIAAMVVERSDAVVASLRREGVLSAAASGSINAMIETFRLLDLSDGSDDLAGRIARIASVKDAYAEAAPATKGALAGALADLMDETRTVAYQAVRAVARDLDDRLGALDL